MNIAAEIETRLQSLKPLYFKLTDDSHLHAGHSGNRGGGHYHILIVSDAFQPWSRLQRQREIQELLHDLFEKHIHALSIKALTGPEYTLLKSSEEHIHN